MKILALDLGNKWVGSALSDALGMFANPYQTVPAKELYSFLKTLLTTEPITTIVVGHPKTMRGTESEQTKHVMELFNELAHSFPQVSWKLWDERLTSKHAQNLKHATSKEDKIKSHSIAAAFILTSYLNHLAFQKELEQD